MRRILVVGGGIAGVEAAITLSRGLPDDRVELLARSESLRIVPDLLYVPSGVDIARTMVSMGSLLEDERVHLRLGEVEHVDTSSRVVTTDVGTVAFDVLVAAPGAAPSTAGGLRLADAHEAELLRDRLDEVFAAAATDGDRASIVIRAEVDDGWAPPAYELALLLADRRRALDVDGVISIMLATGELQPFQWFDPRVADVVVDALQAAGVELAAGVSPTMIAELDGDVVLDFPRLEPRHLPGLPGRGDGGWYRVDPFGRVHRHAFVVGDAASHGFKSAFAAAWEARRVLVALGGSVQSLGESFGGVPVDAVEHQVDLATRTLRIRIPVAARLHDPWLGHDATIVFDDGPPDHLAGLILGEVLERFGGRNAARAHRAMVNRPGSRRPAAGPAPSAWNRLR